MIDNPDQSQLDAIERLEPLYFANEHDLDREVFSPIVNVSKSISCMTGYFTSGALKELAYSISYFLKSEEAPLKFIVSPNLSVEDMTALEDAIDMEVNLIPLLFPGYEPTEDNLRSRAVESLAYLVARKQLILKLGLQKGGGLFHTKCWLFETEFGGLTIHGSVNATSGGLSSNTEQLGLDREWESEKSQKVVEKIRRTFGELWSGTYESVKTVDLNKRTTSLLINLYKSHKGEKNWTRYLSEKLLDEPPAKDSKNEPMRLVVPDWLNYETGNYRHQGEAVDAWIQKGSGILSIATGGGKTLTALVAATLATQSEEKLLVVVTVPTKALLNQWAGDVEKFNIKPVSSYGKSLKDIIKELNTQFRNLRHGIARNEVLIITHDAMKSKIVDLLEKESSRCPIMLIGDEVHNLGSAGFQEKARKCFKYRLGLSATYVRQFDDEGTKFLTDYFGDVVYDFPLDQAIGNCLVPYEYIVHRVELEEDEQEEWLEITYKIRKLSYAANLPDGRPEKERWKLLCLQRRRIIESANGKIVVCAAILPQNRNDVRRTLFFCTDKDPRQLVSLNSLLARRFINSHQITANETSSPKLLSKLIASFNNEELQVLTSKRVLDEGFNIPQTEVAYFLASNTVKRQWVQRLGRVLRLSPETGKQKAVIHDFIVIPNLGSEGIDPDLKSLLQGEFDRMNFFSKLSINGLGPDGSLALMTELTEHM